MATQNIQIKIDTAVDSAESARSLGQLRRSLLDIQQLQSEIGDESSAEFQRLGRAAQSATQRLAQTRERLGDIQDQIRTLDGSPVERMSNSFGLLREGIMNVDVDKLTTAFEGLKASLLSNPIMLIGGIIAAVGFAIYKLMDALGLLQPILDSISAAFGSIIELLKGMTDWLGLTTHAQDAYYKSVVEGSKTALEQINRESELRKAAFNAYIYLNEEEKKSLSEKLGIQLEGIQTMVQAEEVASRQRRDLANTTYQTLLNLEIEAAKQGRQLTDEQVKQRQDAYFVMIKAEEDYQLARIAVQSESGQKIAALDKQLTALRIENITDEGQRRRAEAKLRMTEALDALEKERDALSVELKRFDGYNELKLQIVRKYNQEIEKINRENRAKTAKEELDEFDKTIKLNLLKAEEGSQSKFEIERKGLMDRVELLKKYQTELELSNVDILIEVENLNNKLAALDKEYYTNEIKEFENSWNIKIQMEDENSSARLNKEKEFLEKRLVLYKENYKNMGMSDEELALFEVQTQRRLSQITAELGKKFDFDTGILITQTNLKLQMDKLAELFGKPDALKPYEDYVQRIAEVISFGAGKIGLPLREIFGEIVLLDEERVSQIELISKTFYEQQNAKLQLAVSNSRAFTNAYKLNMEDIAGSIGQTFNYPELLKRNEEYYDELLKLQKLSNEQQVAQTQQEYVQYVIQQRDLYEASEKAVKELYEGRTEASKRFLEKQRADGLSEEDIEQQRFVRLSELGSVYYKSREELQNVHNAAMISLQVEQEAKIYAIEQEASRQRILLKRQEEQERIEIGKMGLGALANLAKVFFIAQKAQAKGNAEEEKRIAREQFQTEKMFNISMAVINGLQSILAITTVPDFTLGVANGIRIAAQVALNAATIAGIAAQEFEGGGSTTGGPPPTPSAPPLVSRPQSQMFQPADFYGLGQTQLAGGAGMGPQRVFVVETDITEVQGRVKVIENRAIF